MDLETENRIAAILLKEAAELRRQAQKEGALAYLREPAVRCKPNSRFLTATVRGVQQANRIVEVNEMWRLRDKQIELDNRLRREPRYRSREASSSTLESCRKKRKGYEENERTMRKERPEQECQLTGDEGLRDDEMEEFLQSRAKRGRGVVGSRMDETGPFLPSHLDSSSPGQDSERARTILGPEKPLSDEKSSRNKRKKICSKEEYCRKQKLKDKRRQIKSGKKHYGH